jgi:8-oxo-dGTP pyrophosphatase MutT (NUDIX family)
MLGQMFEISRPELPPAIPAATLILFDESAPGPALHLMMERSAVMAFMPGALVFPGGRIEPGDRALAACLSAASQLTANAPADAADAAARVAAIRETLEEVGIAVGIRPAPDAATITNWRLALKAKGEFSALLADYTLDLAALVPFAHWLPKLPAPRRFETRFYLARREGEALAAHDEDEAAHHLWLSAAQALEDGRAGRHSLMFPTMANLERLAAHPSFALAQAHAAQTPVQIISPALHEENGERVLRIPEGLGYPLTSLILRPGVG